MYTNYYLNSALRQVEVALGGFTSPSVWSPPARLPGALNARASPNH
jgi:hypothetical protein